MDQAEFFKNKFLSVQTKYETKLAELSVIKQMSEVIRSSDLNDPFQVYWSLLKSVALHLGDKDVCLVFYNSETNQYHIMADSTAEGPLLDLIEFPVDADLGAALKNKKPHIQRNVQPKSMIESYDSSLEGTELIIPLIHVNDMIGFLRIKKKTETSFSHQQIAFLSLVAEQITTTSTIFQFYQRMITEQKWRFNLSRFFSRSITQKILSQSNLKLGGERKPMSIMFADLVGFTSISERLQEEVIVEILNKYFSTMTPIIFKHNGTLDKIMGDGLLAFFGAPLTDDNNPVQVISTAVEMMKTLKEFNIKNKEKGWPELNLSFGLNYGEAIAGYIGSEDHYNYTVIGDTVNVTQRVQSIAEAHDIYITQSLYDAYKSLTPEMEEVEEVRLVHNMKLKGRKQPVKIYKVVIK